LAGWNMCSDRASAGQGVGEEAGGRADPAGPVTPVSAEALQADADTWATYWNSFYASPHPDLTRPSAFAVAVAELLPPSSFVFELGCGNGRDALYFASLGHRVVACDTSAVAIATLRDRISESNGFAVTPHLFVGDFAALDNRYRKELDAVYARFTLHAVPIETERLALRWASANLRDGGALFIEVRSVLGSLYGRGEPAGEDAFIHNGHYRRFIRRDRLTGAIEANSMVVETLVESAGLAVHGDDDPIVVRVVARR
jgi:SAM-dependent methyltransferase